LNHFYCINKRVSVREFYGVVIVGI